MEYTSAGLMEHRQDNMYKMRSELRIGLCLSRFLREVDTVESHIGNIKEDEASHGSYLRVVGLQLEAFEPPADLLSESPVSISAKRKFRGYNGSQASRLLAQYLKLSNQEQESDIDEICRLNNIEANRELILPIKPGALCKMEVDKSKVYTGKADSEDETTDGVITKSSKIEVVKWLIDKESGALKCYAITEALDAITRVRGRCEIAEYGKKFYLSDIENSMTGRVVGAPKKEHKFISMTNFGYIKPIRIENSMGSGFAVDNNYIYSFTNGGEPIPIAYWDDSNSIIGDKEYEKAMELPVYKELEKGLGFIAQHRRFIGPYFLTEENVIKVR